MLILILKGKRTDILCQWSVLVEILIKGPDFKTEVLTVRVCL